MLKIKNYLKSLFVILILMSLACFFAVQLTKTRVAIEFSNRLHNIQTKQTPFVWDFNNFKTDVVSSFQHYWTHTNNQIVAKKGTNPQLSLNFSGDTINTTWHQQLTINSNNDLIGQLKLMVQLDVSSQIYYILNDISLSGLTQTIDLNKKWLGFNANGVGIKNLNWLDMSPKVASMVLQFQNPNADLKINTIKLEYSNIPKFTKQFGINCAGEINGGLIPKKDDLNIIHLTQNCWLPSNYMWLKKQVINQFPSAILTLNHIDPIPQSHNHKVNQLYSTLTYINILLYAFIAVFVFIVFMLSRKYSDTKEKPTNKTWYRLLGKQLLIRGVNTAVKPYHLMVNYLIVLIPSLCILLIMMYFKTPEISDFKKLPLYFLWALLQQVILGYVLARQIFYQRTLNRLLSALMAGAVFSIIHMPSVVLMLATFIAGGLWAYAFLVFKRIIPLAISHALLALMFYTLTSEKVLYSAKVLQWFWE